MGAILCVMTDKLYQEYQGNTQQYQGNDQEYQGNNTTLHEQEVSEVETHVSDEDIHDHIINWEQESGRLYLESLTEISYWALENCHEDQLSKANELKNKIGTIRLSFQTKDTEYKDEDDYLGLTGNY